MTERILYGVLACLGLGALALMASYARGTPADQPILNREPRVDKDGNEWRPELLDVRRARQ